MPTVRREKVDERRGKISKNLMSRQECDMIKVPGTGTTTTEVGTELHASTTPPRVNFTVPCKISKVFSWYQHCLPPYVENTRPNYFN